MFGYIRPLKAELRVREYEEFQAMYCGLCHTLSRRFGPFGRLLVNYDLTFLALVLSEADGQPCAPGLCGGCRYARRRCVASPLRKKAVAEGDPALDFAADASVILTFWRLRDGVRDERGIRALACRCLCACLRPAFRRAARARPEFSRAAEEGMRTQWEREEADEPSLDRAADASAGMLRAAVSFSVRAARDERVKRPLRELFYHVGRWAYIADAWDDLADDLRLGRYNPVALRFSLAAGDLPEGEGDGSPACRAARGAVRLTLSRSAAAAAAAAELLELPGRGEIIKNVLYLGMPAVAERVLNGRWDKRSKRNAGPL